MAWGMVWCGIVYGETFHQDCFTCNHCQVACYAMWWGEVLWYRLMLYGVRYGVVVGLAWGIVWFGIAYS